MMRSDPTMRAKAIRAWMVFMVITCGVGQAALAQDSGKHALEYTYAEGSQELLTKADVTFYTEKR